MDSKVIYDIMYILYYNFTIPQSISSVVFIDWSVLHSAAFKPAVSFTRHATLHFSQLWAS